MRVVLPAVPVPEVLHLAVGRDGRVATEAYDRGVLVEFAYSVAGDRPAHRGTATRPVARQALVEDEDSGRFIVAVDVADGCTEGLPLKEPQRRRPRFLPISSAHLRVRDLSTPNGTWAAVLQRVPIPGHAWRLQEPDTNGAVLNLVITPDPSAWSEHALAALGPRPHPEIVVVDKLDAAPYPWRRAAHRALAGTLDRGAASAPPRATS